MHEGWRAYFKTVADYQIHADEFFQTGERLAIFGTASGTYSGDGGASSDKFWKVPAAWRVVIRDGLVAEWCVYADNQPLRKLMAYTNPRIAARIHERKRTSPAIGLSAPRSAAAERAVARLKHLPFEDFGFAKVDHHRALRQGYAEVVFGKGKTAEQVAQIVKSMLRQKASRQNILVTRADKAMFKAVRRINPSARGAAKFHPLSGVITIERSREVTGKGQIFVVSAGTSDIPVAEEALLTARTMAIVPSLCTTWGLQAFTGCWSIARNFASARVIICVAGMEGAPPALSADL